MLYLLCFQILYNGQTVEVDGHSMKKLINDLVPDTNYSFALTNRGSSAGALQHRVFIRTAPDVFQTKPVSTYKYIHNGQFTLTLPKVKTSVPVRYTLSTSLIPYWYWPGIMLWSSKKYNVLVLYLPTQIRKSLWSE